jgi:hypothetical protein
LPGGILAEVPLSIEQITEYADSQGLRPRVDLEQGLIEGVKVLGLQSRNGRLYRKAAVEQAAALYEGVKVNVNHARSNPLAPRDYQDRLGCLRHVRPTESGLHGDLHFNPKHALAEQLAWDAQHAPQNVGLSHNVQARTSREGGQVIVEEILHVNSVDLVADPATTQGLFEWQESVEEAGRLRVEVDRLRKQVAELEARERRATQEARLAALLGELRLPADAIGPTLRQYLLEVDEATARRLLCERAELDGLGAGTAGRPRSKHEPFWNDEPADISRWARSVS